MNASSSRRRAILRSAFAAAVWPAGTFGQSASFGNRRTGASPDLFHPEIRRTSFASPVVLPQKRALKLIWNSTAICALGVPAAVQRGLFATHNLDVEIVKFGGSTERLLEAIATGNADAGVGMALRWLKPLESGFDVRIAAGVCGGCMRLFTKPGNGISCIADLRGKSIGVSDLTAPDRAYFSIAIQLAGVDPVRDVAWHAYPADLLPLALQRGDVEAFSLGDPLGWVARDGDGIVEVPNSLSGDFAHRVCCVLGVRGSLVRQERDTAAALVQALLQAQHWVAAQPDDAARIFAPYAQAPPEELAVTLRSHTDARNPRGAQLREQIAAYAAELKLVSVLKQSTDPARYAERVTVDVFA